MATFEVTDVTVFPFKEGPTIGCIRGLAIVVLGHQLLLRGLRIIEHDGQLTVGYPNDPFYKGETARAICGPCPNTEGDALDEAIKKAVIDKYLAASGDASSNG